MNTENQIITKIFSETTAQKVLKISPVVGKGFVNKVFLVETPGAKYILRMNSVDSLDEYEKEFWVTNQAIAKNIPTPKILKIGVLDAQAFSIQEYVSGIEGRDFSSDKKFIWKRLGEYAKQIHTINVGGFGLDFRDMTSGDSQKSWLRYLNYNIESLNETDELLRLKVISKTQSTTIRRRFENLQSRDFTFGLNHGDLSLKNTIVDEFENIHLLDWGSSEASIVPHHDLIQLMKVNLQENNPDDSEIKEFFKGYGIAENQSKEMLSDLNILLILRAFDKLRWAIDRKITNLKDYIFHAREVVVRL